ncbi:MAG: hypothetical protein GX452_01760 [Ignavibacteriales bacterium]|nr:hypothetical protein [Ignavibacteriales bacterium]
MAKINLDIYYKYRDVLGEDEAMKLCKEDQKKRSKEDQKKRTPPPPSPDLFLPPMPETLHGLANKIDSRYSQRLTETQRRVLRAYTELGALTDLEMEEAIGMRNTSVMARRNELMSPKINLVEFSHNKINPHTGKVNAAYRVKGN